MREMKDSGIEWIGIIPNTWGICKFKNISNVYTGNSIKDALKDAYMDSENARPYISSKDINLLFGTTDYDNGLYTKIDDMSFKVAPAHSTLMCIEGGSAGRKKTFLSRDVSFVNKLCCFVPEKLIDNRYLYYYLCSPNYESLFNSLITGLIGGVSVSTLRNITMINPPLSEQKKIANYLDTKCAEVDSLVADIQSQIDTLEQYKRSVITEAVTKGLNPDTEMKDSGIDDIGAIPKHWELRKIKYLFALSSSKNYLPLEEVQLLSLYTDLGVFPHGEQEERGNKAVTADGYMIVHKNDIVVNIILAWMGAIGLSNYDGVTSPAYDIYRPNLDAVHPEFYHFLFRTNWFSGECYKYGRGIMAMRWRTYSTEFKNILVPYPPLSEQNTIVDYLHNKCAEIERVIADKQAQLSTLDEYKKSLIYEYVTGKKEVSIS